MSTSIYNVPNWANSTSYNVNDIVKYNSSYYYALISHTSHASKTFPNVLVDNPELWGGVGIDPVNSASKPQFIWIPSYNSNTNTTPRVKKIQFGDGYEQRIRDGINSILLDIDLPFDNRSDAEATAILHFLHEKEATKSFLFTHSPPYNTVKRFVCRSWTHSRVFYDNNSIKVKFEEVGN